MREQTAMTKQIQEGFIKLEQQRLKTLQNYIPTLIEEKIVTDKYVGIVDRYYKKDGLIDDVKTGSYIDMENLKVQGKIYEVLIRSKGYDVEKIQFSFVKLNKVVIIPQLSDEWLENKYKLMTSKIDNQEFVKKQGTHCRYCQHKIRCLTPYNLKEVCKIY
jgi:hypothetical protein